MRLLLLLIALIALPAAAQTVRIYVTNSAGDSIHVIDPATQKVVQVIAGIEGAHGIDFSPDGKRVYVSNESDSTRYLPSFTCETAYITTKKANSSVMKSAYDTSQRSWLSWSLSLSGLRRRAAGSIRPSAPSPRACGRRPA